MKDSKTAIFTPLQEFFVSESKFTFFDTVNLAAVCLQSYL